MSTQFADPNREAVGLAPIWDTGTGSAEEGTGGAEAASAGPEPTTSKAKSKGAKPAPSEGTTDEAG